MVDINWGLLGQQPNALVMYQQGRQDRQRNELFAQQQKRLEANDEYTRQRNAKIDAREDQKWQIESKGLEQEQLTKELEGVYGVLKGIDTPEKLAIAQRDPRILALHPDIGQYDFETIQGLKGVLASRFEKPKTYQGANLGDGGYGAFDPTTGQLSVLREPNPKPLEIDPTKDLYLPSSAGALGGQGRATGQFESFYRDYLAPAEGGYAANDGNGKPVNFGINQGANPDIDVSKLTPEQAAKITYERYWKPSGADQLPPGLAEVHADTAFNMGIEPAKRLLEESGGDVGRYFQLRENRYRSIAQNDPGKGRFLNTWLDRNERLRQYVGGGSGGQGQSVGGFTLARPGQPKTQTPLPEGLGLTDMGGGFLQDRMGRTYQRNQAGTLMQVGQVDDKAVNSAVEAVTGANDILAAIDAFDNASRALKPTEFGPGGKYLGDPSRIAAARSAATNLMMALKGPAMFNLGVITGPDMQIIETIVADPGKFETAVRQGQIYPALRQLAAAVGQKSRGAVEAFKSLGGNPEGLPKTYVAEAHRRRAASGQKPAGQTFNTPAGAVVVRPK